MSYRAKHVDRVKFMDLVAKVKDTQWNDDGQWLSIGRGLEDLLSLALDKLTVRRGNGGKDDQRVHRFRTELLADSSSTLKRVMEPVEPLSVLCHGDFNRNNLLFRYDDGGRPVDALAFDMATTRYASPVLDLSFFLYMNTDRRIRDDHWDALLDEYCAALAAEAGELPVPSRDQLDAEIREYGFYGLAHVSYFARVMLEETIPSDPEEFYTADEFKLLSLFILSGGDKATEWVADALQHFIRFKYAGTPVANKKAILVEK